MISFRIATLSLVFRWLSSFPLGFFLPPRIYSKESLSPWNVSQSITMSSFPYTVVFRCSIRTRSSVQVRQKNCKTVLKRWSYGPLSLLFLKLYLRFAIKTYKVLRICSRTFQCRQCGYYLDRSAHIHRSSLIKATIHIGVITGFSAFRNFLCRKNEPRKLQIASHWKKILMILLFRFWIHDDHTECRTGVSLSSRLLHQLTFFINSVITVTPKPNISLNCLGKI